MIYQIFCFLKPFLLHRYKLLITGNFVLSLLAAVFSSLGLGLFVPVINHFLGGVSESNVFISVGNRLVSSLGWQPSLLVYIAISTFTIILGALISYIAMVCSGYLNLITLKSVKNRLIRDLLDRPYSYFLKIKAGNIVAILTEQANFASNSIEIICRFFKHLTLSIGYLATLLLLSANLTLVMLGVGGIVVYVNLIISKFLQRLSEKWVNNRIKQSESFTESIIGIKTIKSMGLERYRQEQTSELLDQEAKVMLKTHSLHHFQPFFSRVVATILASSGIYVGITFLSLSGADLIVFLLVMSRLSGELQGVNLSWLDLVKIFPSINKVTQYLDWERQEETSTTKFQFEHSIQLKDVSFSYGTQPVLKNIDIEIKKKQFIAVVGPSGGGKSTLIDLILGLSQPTSGKILYDNQPLNYYRHNEWCKSVGIVSQDIFLFNDSIATNIAFGDPEPNLIRVKDSAEIAYAHDFIVNSSEGYETFLGDRGVLVSGGQSQRIALSRSLYHNPQLLILDEATSALDSESERYIQKSLDEMHGQLTIIAVAHRLSTIRHADMIYYIEDGVIKEQGTHEELMQNDRAYKKLKLMQAS
jgi:ABC-type multidrug transport system fused ATPase/permease subunit